MSDNTTQSDSTDYELAVFVGVLGQLSRERYVKDPGALVEKAAEHVRAVASTKRQKVDVVYSRGNYTFTKALDAVLEADVEHSEIDWRKTLDLERERFSENDDRMRNGVLLSVEEKIEQWDLDEDENAEMIDDLEDDRPTSEIVAEHAEISDEDLQDMIDAADQVYPDSEADARDGYDGPTFNADTDEFTIEEHFSVQIREHREVLPYDDIDQGRINRSKAAAMGRTDERFYNDWYDTPQTVDAAILLHDGTDRGMEAIGAARGQNPWVKYPSSCEGSVYDINCNAADDDILNWARYLLETGKETVSGLTDEQEAELRELHTDDELEYMGFDLEGEDGEPAEPAEPASAEAPDEMPPEVREAEAARAD